MNIFKIVQNMGGSCSYSLENKIHSYTVKFNKTKFKTSSEKENIALNDMYNILSTNYSIIYKNALNDSRKNT